MIDFDLIVGFEWDSGNSRKNEVKRSESERRYLALGKTNLGRELTVIFTLRQDATLIRVISARNQHRKERHLYEQAKQ